ncbi:phospho-N-acetylmuramoyl-pentapeptide-transferase [bacterium]|nr:phospho-N-acetylmuramoyl-pentapeptide-transferase [bacterium]
MIMISLIVWGISVGSFMLFSRGLQRLKTHQEIYSLAPKSHQAKQVPSFGGVVIVVLVMAVSGVFGYWEDPVYRWVLWVGIAYGGIGCLDDALAWRRSTNRGLSAIQKLSLQVGIGVWLGSVYPGALTPWLLALSGASLVGASNAANLTDGLDGLLAGISVLVMGSLAVVFPGGFWLMWAIVLLAFLVVNCYPARLFMGDSGSLAIGATLGAVTAVTQSPWPTLILGSVLIVETLSVVIQVVSFKWRHKRVFLMAPLHHHFELKGLSEPKVVGLFWAFQLVCCGVFLLWFHG